MKGRRLTVLCLICMLLVTRIIAQVAGTITLREYDTPMLYAPNVVHFYRTDSVYLEANNSYLPFNFDTYFHRMATLNSEKMTDETHYFFFDIILRMPKAQALYQFEKMMEAAVKHKDKLLEYDATFWRTIYLIRDPNASAEQVVEGMQPLLDQAAQRKDIRMQLQGTSYILDALWYAGQPDYALFFSQALSCLDKLPATEEHSVFARSIFYQTGNAYFHFREYDKALPLLRKALSGYTQYFYDTSNLQALNALANYYAIVNQPDSVYYYAKAMLDSHDIVKRRPMYDAIAATHIADVYLERHQYADAANLLQAALKAATDENDYAFITQIYIGLGKAWLGNGNFDKALQMADSARHYINTYQCQSQNYRLYALLKDYYMAIGHTVQAEAYTDSIVQENKRQEDTYNTLYILRAEQDVINAAEASQAQQKQLIQTLFIILVILIGTTVLGYYLLRTYKKKRRLQASGNQQLKGAFDLVYIPDMDPDSEDVMVMDSINDAVVANQLFRDPDLNTETLASLMGITPQMVVKAVNRTRKKSVARYLIELRIQEATQILSDAPETTLSLEELAIDCGFYDRKSFIRTFRQEVGQTPADFCKLKKIKK